MGKVSKFTYAIVLGVLLVGLVAWIDIQGFNLLGEDYTSGNFGSNVWVHHLITAIIIFSIVPICYWIFYRKDKSEVVGIFLTGLTLFYFGLADVLYFWFQGLKLPKLLPHLNSHQIIGSVSEFFGYSQVTGTSLLLTSMLGIGITYFTVKFLKNKL